MIQLTYSGILAEMGPNAVIESNSDLGSRDMDLNHDWINDSRQRYSNADLTELDSFVARASDSEYSSVEGDEDLNLDYEKLIKAIRGRLCEMVGNGTESPVVVVAPTGVAAFNINGSTIHSTFSIPINVNNKGGLSINGERHLEAGQSYCSEILDSYHLFSIFRCTFIFHEINYPTTDRQLTKCSERYTSSTLFKDNPGIHTNKKNSGVFSYDFVTENQHRWSEVNVINTEKLRHLNVPVAKLKAVHTGGPEAKKADSDMAHGLEKELLLARGSRIML